MKSIFVRFDLPYCRPGPSSFSPALGELSTAAPRTFERLNPYLPSTHTAMTTVPMSSSVALTICTQVVPFMPPMST